jgi:NADPH:quinone reductase-like Zn-dependent oxidoreductase
MESARWAGAVDPVGGATLAYLIRTMKYRGVIASSGLTGGSELVTTVYPFILRGVMLLGIDAVQVDMDLRLKTWGLLAESAQEGSWLDEVGREAKLEDVPDLVDRILKGKVKGRTIILPG